MTKPTSPLLLLAFSTLCACPLGFLPDPRVPDRNRGEGEGESGGEACETADDCENIACLCDDGSSLGMPVNTRHCTNDFCEIPSQACPDSCAEFGYTWTGSVVGDDADSGDADTSGGDGSCEGSSDCPAHTCFCPDGSAPDVRDCWDGVCQGADLCDDQCCQLGHC